MKQHLHLLCDPRFTPFCPYCWTAVQRDGAVFPEACSVCGAKLLPADIANCAIVLGELELAESLPFGPEALLLDSASVATVPASDANGIYSATGTLAVTDEHCTGHFPGYPVFPGHLYPEVANQVFAALMYALRRRAFGFELPDPCRVPLVGRWTRAKDLAFRGEAKPGDIITMRIVTTRISGSRDRGMVIVSFSSLGKVGDRVVYEGTQTCMVSSKHPAQHVETAPFTSVEVLAPEPFSIPVSSGVIGED
ncbi:MAG: hypothetical protein V1907_00820 [Candidatus Kerfeldbacteria bacterium]